MKKRIDRRSFVAWGACAGIAAAFAATGCSASESSSDGAGQDNQVDSAALAHAQSASIDPLPASQPTGEFGIDAAINMETIDGYLCRDDVVYRDMRMVDDPADYGAIGGNPKLDIMLEGFKAVPYPFIGTLQELPVSGAYEGDRLYDVEWNDDGTVAQASPRYEQSELIVKELFPQDTFLFLMCGGGGYANMMRQLLIHLGWDANKVYNVGAAWEYAGNRSIQLITYENPERPSYYMWRADVVQIDFLQYDAIDPSL